MAAHKPLTMRLEVSINAHARPPHDDPTRLKLPQHRGDPKPPPTPIGRLERVAIQRVVVDQLEHVPHENTLVRQVERVWERDWRGWVGRSCGYELAAADSSARDIEDEESVRLWEPEPDLPVRCGGLVLRRGIVGAYDGDARDGLFPVEGAHSSRIGSWCRRKVEITKHYASGGGLGRNISGVPFL